MKRFFLFHEEHGFLKLKCALCPAPGVYKAKVTPYPGTKYAYTSRDIAQRKLDEALQVVHRHHKCAGVLQGGGLPPEGKRLPGNPEAHIVDGWLDTHGLSRAEAKQVKADFESKATGIYYGGTHHCVHFDIHEVKVVEVSFDWRIADVQKEHACGKI